MADPARVLVVDDDVLVRRSLKRVLSRHACRVVEADNGRAAVRLVDVQELDAVISDIAMPDMDGVELLESVQARDANLPVILLTGYPEIETAMKAVEYGAFLYLKKPVDESTLARAVWKAVESCRSARHRGRLLPSVRSPLSAAVPGWSGAVLGGRYRLGAVIGEGGMGVVYEAVREDLVRMRVAVKILHPQLQGRPDLIMRLQREAEIVAAVDHPNIVKVLDFHAPPGGPVFLVMERLHGASLGATLARERTLGVHRAVFIASQVLAALEAAHGAGVLHRDLKPDNVFLTTMSGLRDIAKLLDFGIAKLAGATDERRLTATGLVLGTPCYMAPEYARTGECDARADIYAAGCLLYEMLAGRQPYAADNYNALMFAIQTREPVPLADLCPGVPPGLIRVVEQAMSKAPDRRFATAAAMAIALRPWVVPSPGAGQELQGVLASAPTQMVPTPSGRRRR